MSDGTHTTSALQTDTAASQPYPNRRDLLIAGAGALTGTVVSAMSAAPAAAQPANAPAPSQPRPEARPKPPSSSTVAAKKEFLKRSMFKDKRDLQEAQQGFLAAPSKTQIMTDDGKKLVWDIGNYAFLLKGKQFNELQDADLDRLLADPAFDSIHPSLQRIAILNMACGLYEVMKGKIYQVRGFDLANITFIRSDNGWIVIDPLTSKETAKAALKLINDTLGKRPVKAVIYSHAHGDHFGGVRGLFEDDSGKDIDIKDVEIVAPEHFMEYAVAENVMAGNAMTRRLAYQYGTILNPGPFKHVDQSIGKTLSTGTSGLLAPNDYITQAYEDRTIDGVKMKFQNTPGTESPSEMNTYFPDLGAFWAAENITATIHNIYTLRGAMVRDALAWSKNINEALWRYGQTATVMFASHSWPRFGNERIQEVMRGQRDAYAHLNNYGLFLANQGVTINEVHNVYEPPTSLQGEWFARSYHGSEFHNSRAVINRYIGYWDCNPATLVPLSPAKSAPLYVEMMGADEIMKKGRELLDKGDYLLGVEILNKLVYAQPDNQPAKDLLADMFEQLGYQYESNSLRNSFLAGAQELRNGFKPGGVGKSASPDVVQAMPNGLLLDFLGVRVDSRQAAAKGTKFTMKFRVDMPKDADNDKDYVDEYWVEMNNATLTNINTKGLQVPKADLTIAMKRSDLQDMMAKKVSFEELVNEKKITLDGDTTVIAKLGDVVVDFTPDFQILPGTLSAAPPRPTPSAQADLFGQPEPELLGE